MGDLARGVVVGVVRRLSGQPLVAIGCAPRGRGNEGRQGLCFSWGQLPMTMYMLAAPATAVEPPSTRDEPHLTLFAGESSSRSRWH